MNVPRPNCQTIYNTELLMGLDFWSSTWLVDNILSTYIGYRLTLVRFVPLVIDHNPGYKS